MLPEARLITAVSALELLLVPIQRSERATCVLESCIEIVRNAEGVDPVERESMVSSLQHLKKLSIRGSGKLWAEGLPGMYLGYSAPQFWAALYDERSNIVHGSAKRLSREQISRWSGNAQTLLEAALRRVVQ